MDALQQLMSEAAGTDLSGDGAPEIVSLGYAGSSIKLGEPDPRRRLVLILVESRLPRPTVTAIAASRSATRGPTARRRRMSSAEVGPDGRSGRAVIRYHRADDPVRTPLYRRVRGRFYLRSLNR